MIFRLKFLPLLSVALAAALFLPAPVQAAKVRDKDKDGIPNFKDPDIDGDKIKNGKDPDVDGDKIKNGKDSDIDDDGILNSKDPDVDGDGVKNGIDPDVDGDGILNGKDPDIDGDGFTNGKDPDMDGDGLKNAKDPDVDGDGLKNSKDPDIDGDGIANAKDSDMDGDGTGNNTDSDANGDGLVEPKTVFASSNVPLTGSNTVTNSGSMNLSSTKTVADASGAVILVSVGSFVYPPPSKITSTSSTLGGSISGSGNFSNVFKQNGIASYLTTSLLPTPLGSGLPVNEVTYAPTFSSWFKVIDPSVSGVLTPPNSTGPSFAVLLTSNNTITFHCASPNVSLTTGIEGLDYAVTRNEQNLPVSLKISNPSTALLQNLHNTSYIVGFSIEGHPYEVPAWSIETDANTGEVSVIFDLTPPLSSESISGKPVSKETPVPAEEETSSDSAGDDSSSALDDFEELFDGELPMP